MKSSRNPSVTGSVDFAHMVESVAKERSKLTEVENMSIDQLKKIVGKEKYSKIYKEEFKKMNQCEDKCINSRDIAIQSRLVALVLQNRSGTKTVARRTSRRPTRPTSPRASHPPREYSPDPVSPVKEPELRDPPPLPKRASKRKKTRKRTRKTKKRKTRKKRVSRR